MEDSALNKLVRRLKKIGIEIELSANWPWIYLRSVNGHTVNELHLANHGFTIAFLKQDGSLKMTELKHIFRVIREHRYVQPPIPQETLEIWEWNQH